MTRTVWKLSGLLAALSLASACATFDDADYERPDCHSESTDEDCTNFVHDQQLEGGFRDQGFDEAHRKQGYENLRERRRQQRDQRRTRQPQSQPQTDTGQQNLFERDFEDIGTRR